MVTRDGDSGQKSRRTVEQADVASLAGVPAARLPAALSLLRRHREVDPNSGDEVRRHNGSHAASRAGRATSTLQEMGASQIGSRGDCEAQRLTADFSHGTESALSRAIGDGGSFTPPTKQQRTAGGEQ